VGGNGPEGTSYDISHMENMAQDRTEELQVMLCEQLHLTLTASTSTSAPKHCPVLSESK